MLMTQAIDWLSNHPLLAGVIVFLIAFSESLAFVGLIIPGVFFMLGAGALIATGHLAFWPTVIAAVLGAIAGDGLSYWFGYHYKQQLASIWPFSKYPQLLERGKRYFDKHGGKSVLLGRFIGPLRPIIPAIAGIAHMPMQRFVFTNVASAILWAPLVLLPGILFGLSLEMASEFAGRFTLLLILVLLAGWLLFWLVQQTYLWLAPYTDLMIVSILNWSQRHPVAGTLPDGIINPAHSEVRGLSILAILLIIASFSFITVSELALHLTFISNLNLLVYNTLQGLHTPLSDRIMIGITHLGDSVLLLSITLVTCFWLALYRRGKAVWHMLLAFFFPFLLIHILKLVFTLPRPPAAIGLEAFAFPNGHTTLAMSVYGFLAILLAREVSVRFRPLIYSIMAITVLLIAISRLYLNLHWLTDMLGGLSLGIAWFAFLGIGYRRHIDTAQLSKPALSSLLIIILLGMVNYPISKSGEVTPSKEITTHYVMSKQAWLDSGWEVTPAYRNDLRGKLEFPFNVQWVAELATISETMTRNGWIEKQSTTADWFNIMNKKAPITELPVLPHLHDGVYESIRFIKYLDDNKRILTLRLWLENMYITDADQKKSIWFGNITYLEVEELWGIRFLRTQHQFDGPLAELRSEFRPSDYIIHSRQKKIPGWDGKVLLVNNNN